MLVLRPKTNRKGNIKSFDVVRAEAVDTPVTALEGLDEGEYKVLDGAQVHEATIGYRQVQDITLGGETTTVDA